MAKETAPSTSKGITKQEAIQASPQKELKKRKLIYAWPKRFKEIQKLVSKFRRRDAAVVKAKLKNDPKMLRDFERNKIRKSES